MVAFLFTVYTPTYCTTPTSFKDPVTTQFTDTDYSGPLFSLDDLISMTLSTLPLDSLLVSIRESSSCCPDLRGYTHFQDLVRVSGLRDFNFP